MVAIGGVVGQPEALKQTHQTMDSVLIMKPVTKYSVTINSPEAAGEAVANAFRAAMSPRPGAAFIAFPKDVQTFLKANVEKSDLDDKIKASEG
jgi:acetolactate synthase I/II/III large subunit